MSNITDINTPSTLYKRYLEEQKLTNKDVERMGLKLIDPVTATDLMGHQVVQHCILIPYQGNDDFVRLRKLGKLGPKEGKYVQAKRSGTAPVYLPEVDIDWEETKINPAKPLLIVEGEIKADWGARVYEGIGVIGIAGVNMAGRLFNGDWVLKQRPTYVCFDHDENQIGGEYKFTVHNALQTLVGQLVAAGANVKVLHIGKVKDLDLTKKWGLDDYLRAGLDPGALLNTRADPEPWCKDLAELLENCVYVVGMDHTHIYSFDDGSRKSPSDFHHSCKAMKRWVKQEGKPPRVSRISEEWIEHPRRKTAKKYILDPRLPFGVTTPKEGKIGDINLWTPYPEWPIADESRAEYVRREWQKFMEGLFSEHWKWVASWVAHMLNRPWEKTTQAVMLVTKVEGIGKSLFGEFIAKLTGDHGLALNAERIFNQFNASQEGKIWIVVNELDQKFDSKQGQMNDLITMETLEIEPKGKDVMIFPNYRRWYFTTNSATPCRLPPKQRRILVINPPQLASDTHGEWGDWVRETVSQFKKNDTDLGVIREWFDQIWEEIGMKWDSTKPVPITEAGEDLAAASMTTTQMKAHNLLEMLEENEGIGSVHPSIKRTFHTVFGELSAMIRAKYGSGRILNKMVKIEGSLKQFTVYDLEGKLEFDVKTDKTRWAQIESSEAVRLSGKTSLKLNELENIYK